MPISTDLSVKPYYDDIQVATTNDYVKHLFQPGVTVQTRELNQLQSLLQQQIERFGDNIFATGTIVSGCNFLYMNPYPYIKLTDQTVDGHTVSPSSYLGYQIKNETTGLLGRIINYQNGYESTDPVLKTLYLNYLNTGSDANTLTFSSGDVLKIYDGRTNGIEQINVVGGGTGFSNTDPVFATPAIAVSVTSGSFTNGEYVVNSLGANLQIISVDTSTLASYSQVILKLAVRPVDVANASLTSSRWSFSKNDTIVNIATTASAVVTNVYGAGFSGIVTTTGTGEVSSITISDKGFGYTILPQVTIRSVNNISGYTSLSLTPQNYITKVTVSTVANAVGNGYAFGVNEGVIYQKGYFLKVQPQTIIVNAYSTLPDNVAVGFTTIETIIDHNVDPSLNDPAAGENNGAPGASRLKLTPQLILVSASDAEANTEILPIVEWSAGNPFVQQQETVYSKIGDTMAQHISEQSGNFFVDPFVITTQSLIGNDDPSAFRLVVDPGTAYIDGYRVSTSKNYTIIHEKSINTLTVNNYSVSMSYGNYLQVKELGGVFQFNTGDVINLYSSAKGFLSNTSLVQTQNTSPVGSLIGNACIRSLQLSTGIPGTNSAIYKLYLFDVNMANGKNFADTRSVYYNGTNKGIADVVLEYNSTTGANAAIIDYSNNATLVFPTTFDVLKNSNNTSYTYRTIDQTLTIANTGLITKDISSTPNEFFPYTASLSAGQLTDLYVVPITTDLVFVANATGTSSGNTSSTTLIGTSTAYLTDLAIGDWIYVYDTSTNNLKQIRSIANNTAVVLDSALSFANTASRIARVFPKNVPIPFGYRAGLSANVNVGQNILTINLGGPITATSSQNVAVGMNIKRVNVDQSTKTPNRHQFVKMALSNNAANTIGPWCIGVPDIFRLRGVYIGNSSVSNTSPNYFQSFYIDNNQNPNYYGLGYLYKKPTANISLTSSNYLLVEFDYFTTSGARYFNTVSYLSSNTAQLLATDALPLANLTSTINSWEVPEFFTNSGQEVDLLRCIDFRPACLATATPAATYGASPINPSGVETFDATEKKFPLPDASYTSNLTGFLPMMATMFCDNTGKIYPKLSTQSLTRIESAPTPAGSIKLADIYIPAYPAIPASRSVNLTEIMNTGVMTSRFPFTRVVQRSISILNNMNQTQSKAYTMSDVANIDRRLKNVEYYVSLNQLEATTAQQTIPSSNNPALDRFKFGFFTVNFTNPQLMDVTNPLMTTKLIGGEVVPPRLDWEVYFGTDFGGEFPYIDELIVSQQNATIGSSSDPNAIPNCAIDIANTVAYTLSFRNVGDTAGLFAPISGAVDTVNFTLADASHMSEVITSAGIRNDRDFWSTTSTGSPVELYFYCYDNPVLIQIYQGNTLITDTSSAVNLSATDITNLTGSSSNRWFDDQTSFYMKNFVNAGSGYVKYAGKLTWNYTGAGGQNITIKTTNGNAVRNWRWVLSYPTNGSSAGCAPPPPIYTGGGGDGGTSNYNIGIPSEICSNDKSSGVAAMKLALAQHGGSLSGVDGTVTYNRNSDGTTITTSIADYASHPDTSINASDWAYHTRAADSTPAGQAAAAAQSIGASVAGAGFILAGQVALASGSGSGVSFYNAATGKTVVVDTNNLGAVGASLVTMYDKFAAKDTSWLADGISAAAAAAANKLKTT